MAVKLNDEFGSRATPPSSAYPAGSLKDETNPGVSNDGSPLSSRVGNDFQGFMQSALAEAGIDANGNPDSVENPQILNAIKSITDDRFNYDGLVYHAVGNISDFAGQQLQEADKTNAYQYPDNSRQFYVADKSQAFPVTIPADPAGDVNWREVVGAFDIESIENNINSIRPDNEDVDLFIIYGQSNARGSAADTEGRTPITDSAIYWSRENQDLRQMTYTMESAFNDGVLSTGHAWGAFANTYHQKTLRKTYWIPGAIGGKNITQLSKTVGEGIYEALLTQYNLAIAELTSQGITPSTVNLVFHQGETDQSGGTAYNDYIALMNALFDDFVTDFGVTRFYVASVGNPQSRPETSWHVIRGAQESVCATRDDSCIAYTQFKSYTQTNGLLRNDGTHATQRGYNVMGQSMADFVVNKDRLRHPDPDSEVLGQNTHLAVVGANQPRLMSGTVRLNGVNGLLTRDNNSRFISSFVTEDVTLSSTSVIARASGSKNNYFHNVSCQAVSNENTREVINCSAITSVSSGVASLIIRLNMAKSFIIDTSNGNIRSAIGGAVGDLGLFTSRSISTNMLSTLVSVNHNTVDCLPMITKITSSAISDPFDTTAVVPQYVDRTSFRVPKDIGLILVAFPSLPLRPDDVATGRTVNVTFSAMVSDAAN
ncbi:SGNH hydrolase-type esterase domain protein [Vibrio phage 1.016.O._10N.286.46.A11]|nr:SGNH hydrolase-type esterase domain protein [Vibrio phage 1.016.O._10N.286.46.A11]